MRILGGQARGRRLVAPPGSNTRPTPSRVREALFSMLAANISQARVLDLFAGTGALGIEAISRGAQHAVFVESDTTTLSYLRRNVAFIQEATEVLPIESTRAIQQLAAAARQFELIFIDPPYALQLHNQTIQHIVEHAILAQNGILICEYAACNQMPHFTTQLRCLQQRAYGNVAICLLGLA